MSGTASALTLIKKDESSHVNSLGSLMNKKSITIVIIIGVGAGTLYAYMTIVNGSFFEKKVNFLVDQYSEKMLNIQYHSWDEFEDYVKEFVVVEGIDVFIREVNMRQFEEFKKRLETKIA